MEAGHDVVRPDRCVPDRAILPAEPIQNRTWRALLGTLTARGLRLVLCHPRAAPRNPGNMRVLLITMVRSSFGRFVPSLRAKAGPADHSRGTQPFCEETICPSAGTGDHTAGFGRSAGFLRSHLLEVVVAELFTRLVMAS
jgi:hypothetical protein